MKKHKIITMQKFKLMVFLKKHTLTLFFLHLLNINIYAQEYKPFIENFTPKEYGNDFNPQNWSICEDTNSILYFGNYNSILEFDGNTWRHHKTGKNSGYVVSLLASKENIYVGGNNSFGYLNKKRKYISLSDSININYGNVWRIFKQNNTIIFFTQKALFLYKNNKIKILKPLGEKDNTFHLAFAAGDKIFVRQRNLGLLELKNNKLVIASDFELFKNYGIFGIHKTGKNKFIVVSREMGLYSMLETKTGYLTTRIYCPDDETIKKLSIIGSIKLKNTIALNTETEGIIFLNLKGEILYKITEKHGLISNDVKQIIQNRFNDIWAVTGNGISRINIDSPISFYDEKTGLTGNINKALHFNNKTYVASTNGLFVSDNNQANTFFKKIPNINNSIYTIENIDEFLFAGSKQSLIYTDSTKPVKFHEIHNISSMKIKYIPERQLIITGGNKGVFILKKQNKTFSIVNSFPELAANITDIEYEIDSDNKLTIWIATLKSGIFQIKTDNTNNFNYNFY